MIIDRVELTKLATALGGLPVLACRAGSPAARAGIRYGDIVLAVNGINTPDWASFIEARGKNQQTMQLELFREGAQISIEIQLQSVDIDTPSLLAELIAERIVPISSDDGGGSSGAPN